jgi:hypothetical protein
LELFWFINRVRKAIFWEGSMEENTGGDEVLTFACSLKKRLHAGT